MVAYPMKAEELDGGNKSGFFSRIKRGLASIALEVAPETVDSRKLELEEATVAVLPLEPSPMDAPISALQEDIRPVALEMDSEEVEELVITCEGMAGPQIRRTRGHGATITHTGYAKAQAGWLSPEVEAIAVVEVSPTVAETARDVEVPTVAQTREIISEPRAGIVQGRDVMEAHEAIETPEITGNSDATEMLEAYAPTTSHPIGSLVEPRKLAMANNLNESLNQLMQIDGAVAVALVDGHSGMAMGTAGGGPLNLEVAAAGNSEVVRSKLKVMKALDLRENIEDILISLNTQYHLIRPLAKSPEVFIYLVLNRSSANLAMARFKLASVEKDLQI